MIRYNKTGEESEDSIHLTVMELINHDPLLRDYVIHIPNESKRTPRYGARLKRMGMKSGASDLFIALPRHGYHGAWIEIKTTKGKLTQSQNNFMELMKHQNYFTECTHGLHDTIDCIMWYAYSTDNYSMAL